MSDSPRSRPLLRIAFITVGFLAGVLGIGLLTDWVGADTDPAVGTGTLTIGDETYVFTPTTCFISDEDFAAAGTGFDGSERFWVSASSVSLDLTVGTDNEVSQPADDQVWLVADEGLHWQATGQTVVARASMTDRRTPGSTTMLGALELRCDDT